MDTKSKSFNHNFAVRAVIFVLCAGLLTTAVAGLMLTERTFREAEYPGSSIRLDDALFAKDYRETNSFHKDFYDYLSNILYLMEFETTRDSDPGAHEDFSQEHVQRIKEDMEQTQGLRYLATDGRHTITNLSGNPEEIKAQSFVAYPAYLLYENGRVQKQPLALAEDGEWYSNIYQLQANLNQRYGEDLRLYLAFDEDYLATKSSAFASISHNAKQWMLMALIAVLAALILFIYLAVTTGKKGPDGKRKLYKLDGIFTELQLILIALVLTLDVGITASSIDMIRGVYYTTDFYMDYYGGWYYEPSFLSGVLSGQYQAVGFWGVLAISFLVISLGIWLFLSCIRNIKAGRFLKNALLYKLFAWIGGVIRRVYLGGSVMQKVVLCALAICLLSATVFLAPVVFVLILVFAPRWVNKYLEIKKGVDEVKSGNLAYKIPLEGQGELDQLAKGINEISQASNVAIQNELKNQRLKTDLISNVSHDLKTPLTSIITYVDLLKTEGLDCADAPKYLEVLDQKSARLRKLTEDLFDAAKASSGAIPVRFERVELMALLNQAMGEMADRISNSGLEFRLSTEKEKYYLWADGQLLWRVVENLLSNVLKYAQPGSRVYIVLRENPGVNGRPPVVILEMKNVSKAELNVTSDELMERFTRGDESRTTEGSGLGLAIAKDLMKLQEGWFEIKIDGDLFKAIIMLQTYRGQDGGEGGQGESPVSLEKRSRSTVE